MEPKYRFFNKLQLDGIDRFSLSFEKNAVENQIDFSSSKKYFATNLKAFAKIKTKIENGMTMTNLHKYRIFVKNLSMKMNKV